VDAESKWQKREEDKQEFTEEHQEGRKAGGSLILKDFMSISLKE